MNSIQGNLEIRIGSGKAYSDSVLIVSYAHHFPEGHNIHNLFFFFFFTKMFACYESMLVFACIKLFDLGVAQAVYSSYSLIYMGEFSF